MLGSSHTLVSAAVYSVTNANDSGPGSLREAISNANASNGPDSIVFAIPEGAPRTINVLSALPFITDSVVIDGTSQAGYVNTPLVALNGASAGSSDGLRLVGGSSTIRGLAIQRFAVSGIHILAPSSSNVISANFVGTDTNGMTSLGNGASGGILVEGSTRNLIGGTNASDRNLISGNTGPGIYFINSPTNTVSGNWIGTSSTGTTALGNGNNGITVYGASTGNLIGGTFADARNIISGNGGSGVYLNGAGAIGNIVQGNFLGTDSTGALALPNTGDGVTLNGAPLNTIGGADPGAANVISGNAQAGVGIKGNGTDSNWVQGNLIGTDATGRLPLGNALSGVVVLAGKSNIIGGFASQAGNVISGNKQAGVYLTTNSVGNTVQGNLIGVDNTGTNRLGNAINGVALDTAAFNLIGGTTAGARNIVSGNTNYGIETVNAAAGSNSITGNYIGTDTTGLRAVPNSYCGIHILSSGNMIGGNVAGAGNLISGNLQDGILLDRTNAANNLVQGNQIGTTASGGAALGNKRAGVGITDAAGNCIGGTAGTAGNVISANGDAGIYLLNSGATANVIQGNTIGADADGNVALGNAYEGIYVRLAPSNTIGGVIAGVGNLISGNKVRGVFLTDASWNFIQGNLIGTKRDGIGALGNGSHAVECEANACNNTIGGAGGAANTIAYTTLYTGVRIRDGATNNAILGNAIFGNTALGIDLSTVGITANDACDVDAGANSKQNFPVLTDAVSGNGTGIHGTVNSRPNASLLVQFFANPTCDSSGNGEGRLFLGDQTVVTDGNCTNSFNVMLPIAVPVGYRITATATDSAGNTSEFAACVAVAPPPALLIQPAGTEQIQLMWTNSAFGFVLEETDNLTPIVRWVTVTNAPVLLNGQLLIILPSTNGSKFYRLRLGRGAATPPVLAIRPMDAGHVAVTWPSDHSGFVLKATDTLAATAHWTSVTNTPVVANGEFVVVLATTASAQYFRLSSEAH